MTFQQYIQQKNLDISIFDSSLIGRGTRIDSDFYSTYYLKLISDIKSKKHDTIRNLCSNKINRFKFEEGVFFDYLEIANIDLDDGNYFYSSILGDGAPSRAQKLLKNNDVVISTVRPNRNAVVLISDNDLKNKKVGSSGFCVLRKFKDLLPEYVFVAFKTNIFIDLLVRYTSASLYPAVSEDDILDLPFPIPSNSFQTQIANLVQESYKQKELSKKLYLEAEKLLLSELGLEEYTPTDQNISIKDSEEVELFGRVDAEFFQPKYDEITYKIQSYKGGYDFLRNLFKQNKDINRLETSKINYIEIGDINISNGEITHNEIEKDNLPANAKILLKKDDLLVSTVRPYRGAIAIVRNETENLVGSGAFTVLREKTFYKKETLQILLKLDIYKELMLRYNCGASYPVIKDEDVLNLPIPKIDIKIQEKIAELVKESHKSLDLSKQLLEKAKKSVEIFIEEDEEKALNYLIR